MNRNRFNQLVRPHVREISIGERGLHLARRIREIRETTAGVRPRRRFRESPSIDLNLMLGRTELDTPQIKRSVFVLPASAALKCERELKRSCPEGFKRVRVHDPRHTFGRRL